MSKLEEFRQELIADVKSEASENMSYESLQFIETVSNELASVDKCPVAVPCYFSRIGKRNRKLLVNGYHYDDFDNTMSLFVSDYSGLPEMGTINLTDFKALVKQVAAFIEDSLDGYVQEISDPSDEGYGLARDIEYNHDKIERYCIYVISDRKRGERFKNTEEFAIDNKNVISRIIDIEYIHDSILEISEPDDLHIDVMETSGVKGIQSMEASINDGFKSYLCVVPGIFLATAYKEYGSKLLESNVRSYLGYIGATNRGIRSTIVNEPHLFFAYNNGITTTCTGLNIDENGLIWGFDNLQIVNGGQTTVSIFNEWKKNKDSVSDIFVPMKLTVSSPELAKEIVPNISKYANFQNAVKKSDLDSNDEFQKEMERFSRTTRIPQNTDTIGSTKWYYERTRKQFEQDPLRSNNPKEFKRQYDKSRKIDKLEFGRIRCMILMMPNMVAKGKEDCYNKTFKPLVAKKWVENKDYFNVNYYKETIGMYILYKSIYKELPKREWFGQRSSIKSPLTFYSICKLLHILSESGFKLNLLKIWNDQLVEDTIVRQIASIAKEVAFYIDDIQSRGILATQWFKNEECWNDIKRMNVVFDKNVMSYAVSSKEYDENYAKAKLVEQSSRQNIENNELLLKSSMFWKQFSLWYSKNIKELSMIESSIIKKISSKAPLNDHQIQKIRALLEEAKNNGFEHEELK